MSTLHPDMQALVDARAGLPVANTVDEERANWTAYASKLARPAPVEMRIEDHAFVTPERPVPVRIYTPAGLAAAGHAPAIIYLHGGGFMKGDLDSSDSIAWGFAQLAGAVVISVDYRLTPEHPYPAAFNDAYGVTDYVCSNAADLGLDAARIAIAGDSAGGSLAAATCLAARDRGGPQLAAQALIYPGTGLDQTAGSYVENAQAFGLSTASTIRYRDLYLPDDPHTNDPYARPVLAASHASLPPAWVHPAAIDPIRDDGRVYAAKLAQAGTEVHFREAKNMIHGFMRARFTGAAARAEFEAICGFLSAKLNS